MGKQPTSRLACIIGMLEQPYGATIDDLIGATGSLPHTTRAAITGLRKRGYKVTRENGGAGGNTCIRPVADIAAGRFHFPMRFASQSCSFSPLSSRSS